MCLLNPVWLREYALVLLSAFTLLVFLFFLIFLNIYFICLFLFLAVSGLHCGMQDLFVAAHGLLQRVGFSLVVVCRFSLP